MVTAPQRRQAVCFLQERFAVSERRACRVLGQQRSTQRQPPRKATEEEGRLVAWCEEADTMKTEGGG